MTFKIISEIVSNIIKTIQDTTISQTKVLRKTVFQSEVKNFPEVQRISGRVEVDQSKVESALSSVEEWLKKVDNAVRSIKPTKAVSVTNFPKFPKYPEFPKKIDVTVKNPTESVSVSNHPTKELKMLGVKLDKLAGEFKKVDFKPQIKVEPTPITVNQEKVVFPKIEFPEFPEQMTAKELSDEIFHKDPKEYIPVRLTDGKAFYKAMEEMSMSMSGGGTLSYVRQDGTPTRALVDDSGYIMLSELDFQMVDIEESGSTTYLGFENRMGGWSIMRIVGNSEFRHATEYNNPGVLSYTEAFTNRAALTYGTPKDANY
jgi:hypothetical protein